MKMNAVLNQVNAVKIPSSALAVAAMPGQTSQRYQFLSTADCIRQIEAMGYVLSSAKQAGVLKAEKQGYQKHVLRFRLPEFASVDKVEAFARKQEFPEIVIMNNHTGEASMRIMAGLFRLVCSNGLISGRNVDEIRLRHVVRHGVDPAKELEETLRIVAEKARALSEVAERWKTVNLSPNDYKILVAATIDSRLVGTKYQGEGLKVNETELLRPLRREDSAPNLWTVFNLLQEKAIKSPLYAVLDNGDKVTLRTTRSLDRQVAINKALWQAAESVAA